MRAPLSCSVRVNFCGCLTEFLGSGRIDALYPYCVEAGGATHLDALMVMMMMTMMMMTMLMMIFKHDVLCDGYDAHFLSGC
jgi:hypothetical protein